MKQLRLDLVQERRKYWDARQEITRLKKKAGYEKKYKSLKDDFGHLLAQFQQSEALRKEQTQLIEALKA